MNNLTTIYDEVAEVAGLLHRNGWAEKNAGNFSIRIDGDIETVSDVEYRLSSSYPLLANMVFLFSGKGTRMRDIAKSPAKKTVVIRMNSKGDSYSILSVAKIIPTSELPTHLSIQSLIAQRGSNERAVIHSHVTELIALSHIPEYCDQRKLNSLLWSMHPETIMFIPNGIGFVPFEIPGTDEIAQATVEALKKHQIALWEKHGVFSIATTLNDCYDLLDIAAKSARIFFMCSQSGQVPVGLSETQIIKLKESFQ